MTIRNKLILMLAIPIAALVMLAAVGFRSQSAEAEKNEDAASIATSIVGLQELALDVADERLALAQLSLGADASNVDAGTLTENYETAVATTNLQVQSIAESNDSVESGIADDVVQALANARGRTISGESLAAYGEALTQINAAIEGTPLTGFSADAVLTVQSIQDASAAANAQETVWIEFFSLAPTEGAEPVAVTPQQISETNEGFGRAAFVANSASQITLSDGSRPMAAPASSEASRQISVFQGLAREDLYQNTTTELSAAEVLPSLLENRTEWNAAIESSQSFLASDISTNGQNINDNRSLFTLFAVLGPLLLLTLIFVIGRSILGPLGRLMGHADLMTKERLPLAVAKLRSLGSSDELPDIRPIPKEANDEIGSLVDAFNDVQETAVRVATEQARSRRNVAEMFVSLGRRNQQLNHRMINLITDLEQDEQDPETLAGLYQLDHLATRMRRNAESLLVLAGNRSPRQWSRPVPVEDVIRSSLAEVELFERIEVGDLPDLSMQGNVVTDITHLLAELLDNATQFSEPSTSVSISAQETLEGVEIEVFDEGFGINEHDLVELNERITNPPVLDEAPSRLLGLFVVGRLSQQHNIRVELQSQPGVGTVATVAIPSSLFAQETEDIAGRIEAPAALANDLGAPAPQAESAEELLSSLEGLIEEHELPPVPGGVRFEVSTTEAPLAELEALAIETMDHESAALHEEDLADASMPTMEEVEQAIPSFPDVTIAAPAATMAAAPSDDPFVSADTWPLAKLEAPASTPDAAASISQLNSMAESVATDNHNQTIVPDAAPPAGAQPEVTAFEAASPQVATPGADVPASPMNPPIVESAAPVPPVAATPEANGQVPNEPFSFAPPVPESDPTPAAPQHALPAPPILDAPQHAAPAQGVDAEAPSSLPAPPAGQPAAPAASSSLFGGLPTRAPMAALESTQVTPELIPLAGEPSPAASDPQAKNASASAFAAFATGVNRGLNEANTEPTNQGENQ